MSSGKEPRVWLITGASRGLGLSITQAALAHGDAVIATARKAKSVTDRLGEQAGLLAVDLDVTNEHQIAIAIETAVARFGRVDVLVNNAGYGLVGAIEEAGPEEIRRIYDTNVFGLLNVTRAVLPHLRRQRSGHVINISSAGGYQSFPGYGIYCSTKFAVEGISEALHGELASLGVRVTVVEPGYFRTDFLEDSSIVESPKVIDDYDSTAGESRRSAKLYNHLQPGDPAKLAQAMLRLVATENPPLRLQMGTDALAVVEAKNAFVQQELTAWRELSAYTNF
jgi:NAD(P)-dependent dehydrogenase (short-subunit alcohol dehydrogenase family)